jgi:hypothetical protein
MKFCARLVRCNSPAKYKVATQVNWRNGEDVIIANSVSDDDARKFIPMAGSREALFAEWSSSQASNPLAVNTTNITGIKTDCAAWNKQF